MRDLIAAYDGAIPISKLRNKSFHNRLIKTMPAKKENTPIVVKGGDSIQIEEAVSVTIEEPVVVNIVEPVVEEVIEVEKIVAAEKEVDNSGVILVEVEDTPEVKDAREEKLPRKYGRKFKK